MSNYENLSDDELRQIFCQSTSSGNVATALEEEMLRRNLLPQIVCILLDDEYTTNPANLDELTHLLTVVRRLRTEQLPPKIKKTLIEFEEEHSPPNRSQMH